MVLWLLMFAGSEECCVPVVRGEEARLLVFAALRGEVCDTDSAELFVSF